MKNNLILGRRVLKNGLVIATTFVTCAALHAEDPSASAQVDINKSSSAQGAGQSSEKGKSNQQVEKFVQKAMASGEMEVQMGKLGQTQGQNPEVKALADALVRDHTQANQKLQQLASSKSITADKSGHGDQQKHEQHLGKLKQQTGAEFDKEFVRMALKHHKKDIQEFEKAQTDLNDTELKSFVSETLPKLRQHQQMAQAAAKKVGVDEASIAADVDVDTGSSVGGAAQAESGPREKSPIVERSNESSSQPSTDRPRSSIDSSDSSISTEAKVGDSELSADAKVDADASVEADVDTDSGNKVFKKGDGKVLGLSTDKSDGKFLGIIPNPRKDKDADASIEADADVDVDKDDASVGGSASVETGKSDK
jgi:putative membrane protein